MTKLASLIQTNTALAVFFAALLLLISGCGGGGTTDDSSDNTPPPAGNNAPFITIIPPTTNTAFTTESNVTFAATASDAEDGDLSHNIQWESNLDGALATGAEFSTSLSEGTHTISASVADSAGLTTTSSVSVVIEAAQPSNQAPQLAIISPENDSSSYANHVVLLSANAFDEEDGNLNDNINWVSSIDGNLGDGAELSVQLSVGSHTLTATVTDSGELSSNASVNVVVNQEPNEAPRVEITQPGTHSELTENDSINFIATAQDAEDGNLASELVWSSDLDGDLGQGGDITTQLSVGEHIITATVSDSNGQQHSDSISLTITQAAQMATISWNAPTHNTDNSQLEDLTGFKIYYGTSTENLNLSVTIDDPSASAWVIENLAPNTTYYFSVTAINSAGYESDYSNMASKDT
ncbi:fibronectin type III domain-containing protein [Aliikangiella sp. IMCC44653]